MNCSQADAFVHAYVDGELAGMDRDAYEQHLVDCDACSRACRLQARFKAAIRGHLPRREAPERLKQALAAAIQTAPPVPRRIPWRQYVPMAVAASIALIAVGSARGRRSPVLEQALMTYNAPLPMDVADSNCKRVVDWFRGRLQFALQPQQVGDSRCEGGRLVNMHDRLAAYVRYEMTGGRRLGVIVVDFDEDDLENGARRRVVNGRDVYFFTGRGASAAAFRGRDGLTYVLTSDLDEDSLSNVIQASFH